jgi:hypothetical protein
LEPDQPWNKARDKQAACPYAPPFHSLFKFNSALLAAFSDCVFFVVAAQIPAVPEVGGEHSTSCIGR